MTKTLTRIRNCLRDARFPVLAANQDGEPDQARVWVLADDITNGLARVLVMGNGHQESSRVGLALQSAGYVVRYDPLGATWVVLRKGS